MKKDIRIPRKALDTVLDLAYLAKRVDWDRSNDTDTTESDKAIRDICKTFGLKPPPQMTEDDRTYGSKAKR